MKRTERKSIPNCPGYYADRRGNIWRKLGARFKLIRPVRHHDGSYYTYVGNDSKKELTRRLVCSAFKGENPLPSSVCIGKAKHQQARRLKSQRYLKWGSHEEVNRGDTGKSLSDKERLEVVRMHKKGMTQIAISKKFGITQSAVSQLLSRRSK
jgi:DNA-binding NarL/FixJ family response regulator